MEFKGSAAQVNPDRFAAPRRAEVVRWNSLRDEFLGMLPPGSRILEIGPGREGEDTFEFRKKGFRVVPADVNRKNLHWPQSVQMNLGNLGVAGESIDAIWAANVLVFIRDNDKRGVLKSCAKILKPGGIMFICDNFFESGSKPHHLSSQISEMVSSSGFTIVHEMIGVDIPEKRGFTEPRKPYFHIMFARKT